MHHNGTSPKGQRTKLIVFMANWVSEMRLHGPIEDVLEHLQLLKLTYLHHEWADDREERIQVMQLFEQLEHLMQNLSEYDDEDFEDLDQFILNLAS